MKQLIFCFDGTSNDPSDTGDFAEDKSISNVLKMHLLLGGALKNGAQSGNRRSFYYQGIGTYGGVFKKVINAMFAPPQMDMKDIIASAEDDLQKSYRVGDEIFIFGFSRGAAIARMFAAKHVDKKPIKLLGVFDTVAATKNSLDLRSGTYPASGILFEDGNIAKHIQEAVHAVSIDEQRVAFQPTLFNQDERVTEVWFAGVHSDVGGGYWFDGLSDIALDFMLDKAAKSGLEHLQAENIKYAALKEGKEEYICLDDVTILPQHKGKLHAQHRSGILSKRTLAPHYIRVNGKNDKPDRKSTPVLHHTVIDRFFDVADYRPLALRNVKFRVMDKRGIVDKKTIRGIEGIRKIKEADRKRWSSTTSP